MGTVWQLSPLAPIQTLGVTHEIKDKDKPLDLSPDHQPYLQFSLKENLYQQLTLQLYQEQLTLASSVIAAPIEFQLPLPNEIVAQVTNSQPLQDPEGASRNVSQYIDCKTSILGLLNPKSNCVQWIILWHQKAFSSLQGFSIHQQAELFQQYLIQNESDLKRDTQIQPLQLSLRSIHHQLKTPLEIIQIHKDLIVQYSNSYKIPNLLEEYSSISNSLEQIQVTLDNIRYSLKRLTANDDANQSHKVQDLGPLFKQVLTELRPLIEEKSLSIQQENTSCPVWVDSWEILQVFHNLLHNAIKFSPYRGNIICQCQRFKNEVLIQISDQGPGLANGEKEEVFLPFYSNRTGGMGLGLTIAKQIVLEHRGRIWAETLTEGGTQFSIVLPLSKFNDSKSQIPP